MAQHMAGDGQDKTQKASSLFETGLLFLLWDMASCQGNWHGQAILAPWCFLPSSYPTAVYREEALQSQVGRGETQSLHWGDVALQETAPQCCPLPDPHSWPSPQ